MKMGFAVLLSSMIPATTGAAFAAIADTPSDADNFYKSDEVIVKKGVFPNQYEMNIAGNLIMP